MDVSRYVNEHAETLFMTGWCLILLAAAVIGYIMWCRTWEPELDDSREDEHDKRKDEDGDDGYF